MGLDREGLGKGSDKAQASTDGGSSVGVPIRGVLRWREWVRAQRLCSTWLQHQQAAWEECVLSSTTEADLDRLSRWGLLATEPLELNGKA